MSKSSSKKQIEKQIEQAEIDCKKCYGQLSDLQFKALVRIRERCEGVRPRWGKPDLLVCSLVMQGLSGKWQEQRFAIWFKDPQDLRFPSLSKWNRKGEFYQPISRQVLSILEGLEKEIKAAENPYSGGLY